MSYQVINPFIQFVDTANGQPLGAGQLYFGRQDSDPKNQPANRINVYAVQDNGSEVLLSQPITLNAAGQPQYNGSVKQIKVELYAGENSYAVQVFSKSGAQKGYSSRVYPPIDSSVASKIRYTYGTVNSAISDLSAVVGQSFNVINYFADSNDEQMTFTWVAAGTGTPDGGSFINHLFLPLQAKQIFTKNYITVWQFGASRTNSTNNHTCFLNAYTYGYNNNIKTISIGIGVFETKTRLVLPSSMPSMEIIGTNENSPQQQGSSLGQSTWRWTGTNAGGNERVIECDSPWIKIRGFGFQNNGASRDFILFTSNAIGAIVEDFSAILATGTNQLTRAVFATMVDLGYAVFRSIRVQGAAPRVISIAQGGATGMTPLIIEGRSFFETTGGAGPMTVVYVENTEIDSIIIRDSTFNQPADELCIIDTTTSAATNAVFNLVLDNIEWDKESSVGAITDKALKLKNIKNLSIRDLSANCSSVTNLGTLENVNLNVFESNYVRSVTGNVFAASGTTTARIGRNRFDITNVAGVITGAQCGRYQITYAALMYIRPDIFGADEVGTFRIDISSAAAWEVMSRNGTSGYAVDGQKIILNIRNVTAGVINAGTFGVQFRLASAATAPATGKQIAYTFEWDAAIGAWLERARSGEVANA